MKNVKIKTNLRELANNQSPSFGNLTLNHIDDDYREEDRIFLDGNLIERKSVNLDNVAGFDQGYSNKKWKEILFEGISGDRRIDNNLRELEENPDYYLNSEVKVEWSFIEIEGKLFIDGGKHRTTILRYLAHFNPEAFPDGPIAKNVSITTKRIDYETESSVKTIREHLQRAALSHLELIVFKNHDGEITFMLQNIARSNGALHLSKNELKELVDALKNDSKLARVLGGKYHSFFRKSLVLPW